MSANLKQFIVEVLQDEAPQKRVWEVAASSKDDAIQLAFALDGGWSRMECNATDMLQLAKSYCSAQRKFSAEPEITDLLSCPFCGSLARGISWQHEHAVACSNEECEIAPVTDNHTSRHEAAEAWNQRARPTHNEASDPRTAKGN